MTAAELTLGLIPHGVVYLVLPEQEPRARRRDLENIRALGFNTLVIWPAASRWDADLPGGLAFDSIDQVMDGCAELGLRAILELQGQDDNHGPAPEWSEAGPVWPNPNHPSVRRATCDFLREVARHFKRHPALLAYDLFNELHYTAADEWSLREFAEWLKRRYRQQIRELNAAWATFHRSFEEIPAHGSDFRRRVWSSALMQRDWYRFQRENSAERLREWARAVREEHPDAVVFADILGCDSLHNRTEYGACDWLTAAESDVHGLSCYANMLDRDWKRCDAFGWSQFWRQQRSAARGKQLIISEMMTHNRSMFPREGSSMTDQLGLWSQQALFNGVHGLIYWKYRPFARGLQVSGRGLTDAEGNPNALAEQARVVGQFSARHADLLAELQPDDAGAALLFDHNAQDLYMALQPWDAAFYCDAQRGLYRGFWEHGVGPRYLLPEDVAAGVPGEVRVLTVPCNVSLAQPTAAALLEFVQRGGVLFSEGRFGLVSEDGVLHPRTPGAGLSDALGVRETGFVCDADDSLRVGGVELGIEELSLLELAHGTEVLARSRHGRPIAVARRVGSGLYVHAGLLLGRLIRREAAGALALFGELFCVMRDRLAPVLAVLKKDPMLDVSVLVDRAGRARLVGICNYRHEPSRVELASNELPRSVELCEAELTLGSSSLSVVVPARKACALLF